MLSHYYNTFKSFNKEERWLIINVMFLLASCYSAALMITIQALRVLFHAEKRKRLISFSFMPLLFAWALMTMVTGLVYRNWLGVLCSVLFFFFIIFALDAQSIMNRALSQAVIRSIVLFSIIAFMIAIIQKISGVDRVAATFYNPNFYAFFAEIMIVLAVYEWIKNHNRILMFSVFLMNVVAILLTECRSAWLAAFIGVIVLCIILNQKRLLKIMAGCLSLAVVAILKYPSLIPRFDSLSQSFQKRQLIWDTAWSGFLQHPIFGQGFLSYRFFTEGMQEAHYAAGAVITHAHNLYLDLLINFGMAGSILIVVFFFSMIQKWIAHLKTNQHAALVLASFTALLVHGITDVPVIGFQTGTFLMLLMALPSTVTKPIPIISPALFGQQAIVMFQYPQHRKKSS